MKFVVAKLDGSELIAGEAVELSDLKVIEVPDDSSEVPHKFVMHPTYTGEGCAMCGQPESARRHHYGH